MPLPWPSPLLLCLASACAWPVPASHFLSPLFSVFLLFLGHPGPLVPSALLVWGFFGVFPLPTSPVHAPLSPIPLARGAGGQSPPCSRACAGAHVGLASGTGRCRFSTTPSSRSACGPRAAPLAPAQPLCPPTHPLLLLGQNSSAPHGCCALQGLYLIPMMRERTPGAGGGGHPAPAWLLRCQWQSLSPGPSSPRAWPQAWQLVLEDLPHALHQPWPRLEGPGCPVPPSPCTTLCGGCSPQPCAPLHKVVPRDQRTGISTVSYTL